MLSIPFSCLRSTMLDHPDSIDNDLQELQTHEIEIDRELARRSFYEFYLMAWPWMDPEPFIAGQHIKLICYHLQRAARREERRMVICIPPRYSKSLLCSVAFPAWVWTWWPSAKFITCSYAQPLATRDATATRRLIESPWYQARWPEVRFRRDQNQKTYYETVAGGLRFVGSPGTGVTGHGSDFNIFDDPHDITQGESDDVRERAHSFWFETMSGRFNNPARGVGLVIQQRVHEKDVAGECIRRGYFHVILPARFEGNHPQRHALDWRRKEGEPLWPEKFSSPVLDGLWKELLDYAVAGQQQQRPAPREGGLFKREWFKVADVMPEGIVWVRAWDLAATEEIIKSDPDYTAGVKFGWHPPTKTYWIGHVIRFRKDPGGVEEAIKNIATQDGKDVPIFIPQDPAQAGKWQIRYLVQQLDGFQVKFEPVTGSKETRAMPLAAQAKIGNVHVFRAAWNEDFFDELGMFPGGAHDDQVDAAASGHAMFTAGTSGIFNWLKTQADSILEEQNKLRKAMGLQPLQHGGRR